VVLQHTTRPGVHVPNAHRSVLSPRV
jgi:hypothetical protein